MAFIQAEWQFVRPGWHVDVQEPLTGFNSPHTDWTVRVDFGPFQVYLSADDADELAEALQDGSHALRAMKESAK